MSSRLPMLCTFIGCGAINCSKHGRSGRTSGWRPDADRGNRHQRGYGKEWEQKRGEILERDNHLCIPCKQDGRVTPANQVDHIIQKADGGTDHDGNLQSICLACHRAKTARESNH